MKSISVLTDEEMEELHARHYGKSYLEYNRAVEAAVLEKLKQQEPVAFEYEIGTSVFSTGEYTNWIHQVTSLEPNTPLNAIRNLRPLYAAPMPADVVKDAERYRLLRRGQHWSVIDGIGSELRADSLDDVIDATMEKKK